MARSTLLGFAYRMSPRQWTWTVAGLVSTIVLGFVTSANLHEIYRVQPDFILGALLSVASFCFAKATTRTGRDRALEELHRTGAVTQIHLARRNTAAARERLIDYFHNQAESQDFLGGLDLYQVIIGDVEYALTNIDRVIRVLPGEPTPPQYSISKGSRQILLDRARDVREALRRGERTRQWLAINPDIDSRYSMTQIFTVLISDVLKADLALHELCAMPLRVSPVERLIALKGYLDAAHIRSTEFQQALQRAGVAAPDVFKIMVQDLDDARKALPDYPDEEPVEHVGE
jgi:hypothetical protein